MNKLDPNRPGIAFHVERTKRGTDKGTGASYLTVLLYGEYAHTEIADAIEKRLMVQGLCLYEGNTLQEEVAGVFKEELVKANKVIEERNWTLAKAELKISLLEGENEELRKRLAQFSTKRQ